MKVILPTLLLLAVGCSTTGYMRDAIPTLPPGPKEAKVVVYRTAVVGGFDNFPVYEYVNEDGKLLGFTETGCYFEYRCEPGKHFFLTWGEGDAFIEADLAPGKIYYIQAWSKFGILSSRPGFAPVAPGTDAFRDLEKAWPELRCRELDPDKAPDYELRKEDRVREARAVYEAGHKAAERLEPGEGRVAPVPVVP
jgi:hypothetical protein